MSRSEMNRVARHHSDARLVVIESPYAGDIEANVAYARLAMRDALSRGEFPIASHLLYTQPGILRDEIPEERRKGIMAGLVWGARAGQLIVFYCDRGISTGMQDAAVFFRRVGIPMEARWINGAPGMDDPRWIEAARLVGDPV